jgi:hypothetical protein
MDTLLFLVWLAGTTASASITFALAVKHLIGVVRGRCHRSTRLSTSYLGLTLVAVLLNPVSNWLLFHPQRDRTVARMLTQVGQPTTAIVTRYGRPRVLVLREGTAEWRYQPGPWYVLLPWEEVVYRVKDERVQAAFIDD